MSNLVLDMQEAATDAFEAGKIGRAEYIKRLKATGLSHEEATDWAEAGTENLVAPRDG